MQQIDQLGGDYTVHLGEVYPRGAEETTTSSCEDWTPGMRGSLNLNSNHDM